MRVGVLALQGAFIEHEDTLSRLGAECFEIRRKQDLAQSLNGLVIPGGESTVMGKLLRELELFQPLKEKILKGLPVFGTCAGLLLLAESIENGGQTCFGTMPITAVRNAYGRQLGSFQTMGDFNGREISMTFIRAPYVKNVGAEVKILSKTDERITAARWRKQLVTAFHPELTGENTVHEYFLSMIAEDINHR